MRIWTSIGIAIVLSIIIYFGVRKEKERLVTKHIIEEIPWEILSKA